MVLVWWHAVYCPSLVSPVWWGSVLWRGAQAWIVWSPARIVCRPKVAVAQRRAATAAGSDHDYICRQRLPIWDQPEGWVRRENILITYTSYEGNMLDLPPWHLHRRSTPKPWVWCERRRSYSVYRSMRQSRPIHAAHFVPNGVRRPDGRRPIDVNWCRWPWVQHALDRPRAALSPTRCQSKRHPDDWAARDRFRSWRRRHSRKLRERSL